MKKIFSISVIFISIAILQGCGPKTFAVKNSELSTAPYHLKDKTSNETLSVKAVQTAGKRPFSFGKLKINLELNGEPVEPIKYLEYNVLNELADKGIQIESAKGSENVLSVTQFYIRNHRTNGYTPFITFSNFKGTLAHAGGTETIAAYVKRGKVPVWSFNEVIEPTLNEPLALISKEVAAKINQIIFGYRISDQQVKDLVADIHSNADEKDTYLKVYELGFGNNQSAIKDLVEMTKSDEEYVRLAAISSLGILKAESHIDLLWSIYQDSKIWQDRAMALKALGDISSEPALSKLKQAQTETKQENEKAIKWFAEVFDLYL